MSLTSKLEKVNLAEGLIDFSSRFSLDDITSIVLQNCTWGFFQCEPSIWFVAGYYNSVPCEEGFHKLVEKGEGKYASQFGATEDPQSLFLHHPNGVGIHSTLSKLYYSFQAFNGLITSMFDACWDFILTVASTRRAVRVLQNRLQQLQQDWTHVADLKERNESDNLESEGESAYKSIEEIQESIENVSAIIREKNALLQELNDARPHRPRIIKQKLSRHIRFCMRVGEGVNPSAFYGMPSPMIETSLTKGSRLDLTSDLMHVRSIIQKTFCGQCIGTQYCSLHCTKSDEPSLPLRARADLSTRSPPVFPLRREDSDHLRFHSKARLSLGLR